MDKPNVISPEAHELFTIIRSSMYRYNLVHYTHITKRSLTFVGYNANDNFAKLMMELKRLNLIHKIHSTIYEVKQLNKLEYILIGETK